MFQKKIRSTLNIFTDIHRHSKTCHIGNTHKCRFGFPVPPMPKTLLLEPIECDRRGSDEFKAKMEKDPYT